MKRRWGVALAPAALALLAALAWVLAVLRRNALSGNNLPSVDVYAYSEPLFLQAQRAWQQGHGLLWNELQSCGQPFLGIVSTALLYPPSWPLWYPDPFTWLLAQAVLHLFVAALGSYGLARELGLSPLSAAGGALTFALGGITTSMAGWSPLVLGTYVWMPVALLWLERWLRSPRPRWLLALVLSLTFQLLAGFPQILVFTYELLALRVVWELATRRQASWAATSLKVVGALALPALLGAVQLLPTLETAAESVRSLPASAAELDPKTSVTSLQGLRNAVGDRHRVLHTTAAFSAVAALLAGAALGTTQRRRIAGFYTAAGALFLALFFDTPLLGLYQALPAVGGLRNPARFLWVVAFCISVLVAFGLEALPRRDELRAAGRWLAPLGAGAGAAAFWLLTPDGLLPSEWVLIALAGVAAASAGPQRAREAGARALLAALLVTQVVVLQPEPLLGFRPATEVESPEAAALEWLRERATPQERVYTRFVRLNRYGGKNFSLSAKGPSRHGLASIYDYEHLTSAAFADVYVTMVRGQGARTAGDWIRHRQAFPKIRPLFNLLAARYVVTDEASFPLTPRLRLIREAGGVRVFENPNALPRAFYVPTLRVEANPKSALNALSSKRHPVRRLALVEQPPADGFLGSEPPGYGDATIRSSRSETLTVEVTSSDEGFLFVSDQYHPGWTATVDGEPREILRANRAFRVVRVPSGSSEVVFRFAPRSLRLGVAISVLAAVGLAAYAFLRRRVL